MSFKVVRIINKEMGLVQNLNIDSINSLPPADLSCVYVLCVYIHAHNVCRVKGNE